MFPFSQTITGDFFDAEMPQQNDYARVALFDRSNALGEDKLGRLAEVNKTQLEQALRDMNGFARTDAGFNRQLYQRGTVSNSNNNRVKPMIATEA